MSKNRNNRRCAAISTVVFWCVFIIAGIASAAEIQLAWNPPTTNSDGTPITDLAGYRIYYSTVSGSYPQYVDVGNRTTYTITNLAPGTTYYFVATAYNTAGGESGYSNMVAKTTPAAPQQYSLTVNKSGTGTGTVTGTGINCGTDCTEPYNQGTVVTLSAAPATGSTFAGWSGNCT
ncbi:MAG: fibronectin type III domain-containing protein, partial [Nitrospirota bacterium]